MKIYLREELQGNSERSQPTDETKDDAEARNVFWSIELDFIYRHHVEPRVQVYVPKEESLPIPLKCLDVTRTTHTNLDVLQESRTDDCWNVNADPSLSDSWTGFTKFPILSEKPPEGYTGSGRRLTKIQATARPENLWPEVWSKMGEAAQKKEEQGWPIEKPKLDNTRRLRGFCFIDPENGEYKETIKDARKRWEIPMEAAMSCKMGTKKRPSKLRETDSETKESNNIQKTKRASIVEAHDSTRKRLESLYQKIMKITSQAKDTIR